MAHPPTPPSPPHHAGGGGYAPYFDLLVQALTLGPNAFFDVVEGALAAGIRGLI